jgi:LPXTG-motif cell wall-anchored protein
MGLPLTPAFRRIQNTASTVRAETYSHTSSEVEDISMKRACLSLVALMTLMGTSLAPVTKADPLYKRTEVTFNQPVEIPGMVLMPGKYVMKLLDPYMDRNIVRFYNAQENHMYAMVSAVPDYRLTPTDHTVITFEERAHNAPQAIKAWFPAGDNWGEEFVYPKAESLTASVEPTVPQPLQPRPTAIAPAATSEAKPVQTPAPAAQVQPQQQLPVEIAQAQPVPASNSQAAPAAEQKKELPKTASDLPMATLIGGLSVLAGVFLRRRSA